MELKELLIKVRARIDKPQKWISFWSQSDDGRRLGIDGAVWAVANGDKMLETEAFKVLAQYSGINALWGDHHRVTYLCKHTEVMAMLDKAIESQ